MRKNTPKQTEASRANGGKGKGATSVEGKEAVRFNATKDGIFSTQLVVESAGERIQDFEKLRDELWQALQPQTTLQRMLAIDVIENRWKMQRVRRAETLALQARVEDSWIQDELHQSAQLDNLKAEFFKNYGEYIRLSTPRVTPDAFDLQLQMEAVRSKLAATSRGLEFLIGLAEKVEQEALSAPYLSWGSVVLIFACVGFGNDAARICEKLNLVNIQVNKMESADSRKKQKPQSGIGENPNVEEGETNKLTDEKLRERAFELLRWEQQQKRKSDKQTGDDKKSRSDTERKSEKAETTNAPTPEAWFLAQAVREAILSLKITLQLVSQQEKLDEKARKNDAIVPLAGADRFLRAESVFERRMYRALSLLLAMRSGVVEGPPSTQLPQPDGGQKG
jgi:hypothetical protein